MGRIIKRNSRINKRRGTRASGGDFAGRAYRRADGAIVKVGRRVGTRNRTVYSATVNNERITVTAKAIRKMRPAF